MATFCLLVQLFILLRARFTLAELINPMDIPLGPCEPYSGCWHYSSRPDQIGPCGIDTSTCPPDSKNCGMYESSCYCQQKTQLQCAWVCQWWDWMIIEDWLFNKCPDAPTIDFNKAPACARRCLEEKSFDYGCLTRNTNCFCIHGSLFDCQNQCADKDKQALKSWLVDTCGISEARADAGVMTGDFTEEMPQPSGTPVPGRGPVFVAKKRRKPRWYEIMAFTLLGLTFLGAIGFMIWMRWTEWKRASYSSLPSTRDIAEIPEHMKG
ncbi:uncharacterized protein EI97DRAFT_435051 [Westerdykella ornata]|uniref:Extracellular membrane protein CFEM domain-containing protein n=1 Tax=Westerdykella ornata TaxID=318751 RepID=A0A6A6JH08_WESOR|nr:uncharacterized protein EI97DRAFT_435051 [Westerdykella ornata]KAF2274509.1 hypothetical protein EI97DRAFT_435051 [Westerdykella ornata]